MLDTLWLSFTFEWGFLFVENNIELGQGEEISLNNQLLQIMLSQNTSSPNLYHKGMQLLRVSTSPR